MSATRANVTEGSTRVLVVDDELNITELVSLGLRYEGFDVLQQPAARPQSAAATCVSKSTIESCAAPPCLAIVSWMKS